MNVNSTIFKEQFTSISTVLNNTGNTTKLLTSFSALDVAQQKVLLSSKLLTEEQKVQCATMATLTSANAKYTAEQIAKATGVSAETLANLGLINSTDTLTISELAEKAASDAQAKSVLEKIIVQNAQAVANGEVTASNVTLATSEGGATLATGAFTTAIKANIKAMWTWMTTTPVGWITMLVGGILGAVTAYNALTDSVEETKEKAEDLISTYKTALDTANSHKDSIDNIADRYEELSKGVNNLGENVSLTAEEYQEYNSIVNDIAEMFPTMVQGYTDEGNAILKLKGNVDALREAYEAEAQAAYNSLISTGKDSDGNDILKDANNVITGSTLGAHDWGNAEKIDYLDKLMDATDSVDSMLNLWDESLNSAYSEWFEDFAGVGGTVNIGKLTDEDLANIRKNAKILKQQYQAEIDSAVDNAETLANAYLMTNEDYAKLDEQSKNAASIMVNSLNADIVSKFGEDKENVGKYVDDIVQIISTNPDAKDAMIGLFTMDTTDMPVDDIEYWTNAYIDTIAKILQEDPAELKIRLGFDNDTTEPLKTKVQGFLKDEFDGKVGELTLEELEIASSKLEIPEGTLLTWDELIAKIREVQGSTLDNETTTLFDDIFSLKNADDTLTNLGKISEAIDTVQNAYKTLDGAIDEYNENGSFSIDTLQSVIGLGDDWLKYLVDEEGNLSLNKEALQELTRSRLEDMRIQTINNLIDNVGKIENETQALRYLTEANYDLGDSYEYVAAQSLQLKLRELENKGVSSDTISKIAKQSMSDMQKINDFFNNVDLNTDGSLGGSGGSGSSSSTSSSEDNYRELVDFFERRIEVLNDANSLLEKNLENVTGSFAKNNLIDSQLGIAEEKYRNYTDAISMYSKKAGEALSKLPADIAEKVKNGSVSMTDFIGGGNEDVVNAINDYQDWANKIADCKEELAALKETIRDLELDKFNNIIEDFTNQFDLYEDANDLLGKQISLLEEAGELIGESFYSTQIEESQKQLSLLEEEKATLVNQLNSALSSGRIQAGTDEWLEMVNALSDVDGSILDCKTSIEELDNALLDLHTQVFERIQEQFSNLNSELENLFNLFDEDADVTNGNRNWTDEAVAQLGLLAQQYELSQYQIQQYDKEIEQLNADYLNGKYSATEYADKLADLSSAQWDAVNSSEAIKDSIVDLNKTRVDEIIEGIEEEINAYRELADSKIEALDAERDLKEYRDSIAEKSKSITDLEKQITAMQNDDTAATIAKRLQLEEQLAEAKKELEDAEYDHSIESQKNAINQQYEDYESARNDEIEALEESLKDKETLIYNSFEMVKANSNIVGGQIATIATQHGVKVSDSLISSWKSGENAIASYGTVLSENSSAFIGNIIGVENEVLELQNKANETASTLSDMFSIQADTLVSELENSYNSEENLRNMTYALQDSLVNTLERGYNINNIVNALDTIADKAEKTWDSVNGGDSGDDSQTGYQWRIVDNKYGTYLSRPFDTQEEALSWADTYAKTTGVGVTLKRVKKYANGTRNAKNGLRIINEEGYELTLPKVSSGNYTIGNAGDQILTKAETDNIFDWAKINPNMFDYKPIIPDTSSFVQKSNLSPVSINYDSLIRVDGDVNNSNIRQIEAAVEAGIKKLSDDVNRNYRYGKR